MNEEYLIAPKQISLRIIDDKNFEVQETTIIPVKIPEIPPFFVKIPHKFHTDLASVPRFLWAIYPPFGTYCTASVLHDYLYRSHNPNITELNPAQITRKTADLCFLHTMLAYGTPKITAYSMYYGVRAFGASSYQTKTK